VRNLKRITGPTGPRGYCPAATECSPVPQELEDFLAIAPAVLLIFLSSVPCFPLYTELSLFLLL
jgi:hypothetical protein